eukprot:scaffold337_cov94-Cylindrotheca_fusiformis.AAC.1
MARAESHALSAPVAEWSRQAAITVSPGSDLLSPFKESHTITAYGIGFIDASAPPLQFPNGSRKELYISRAIIETPPTGSEIEIEFLWGYYY